jgi:hypothetical protein
MQALEHSPVAPTLRRTLVDAVASDGGWAYYEGRRSRLEPTSWALLVLAGATDPVTKRIVTGGSSFLRRLQGDNGLLVEEGTPGPNLAWNALALLAAVAVHGAAADPLRDGLQAGLLRVKGVAIEQGEHPVRQDNRLQAWSWTEGTFSWIEPTALGLLALKKSRASGPVARTRIAEAEAVIVDRVCDGGGWNYGNAEVLGQDLRPYVPTTALALLAMQDRREHPAVVRSLEWLTAHAVAERAAMALSLAAICLHVFGRATSEIRARLIAQHAVTAFLGNRHLAALALYALTLPEHDARTVRLS